MREFGSAPEPLVVASLHARKNEIYAELVASGSITPRLGILSLIEDARRRTISLAIATTTSRANLTALLSYGFAPGAEGWFSAIVAGEDVARKKPHPEVYRRALDRLALDPSSCVAIEDTRNGLDAALAAGLRTVITPSHFSRGEVFAGAASIVDLQRNAGSLTVDALEAVLSQSMRPSGNPIVG